MSRSRQARQARRREQRRGRRWRGLMGVGIGVAVLGGGAAAGGLAIHSMGQSLEGTKLQEIKLGQNTRIYDKNGTALGYIAANTNRTEVRSGQIPQVLKDATVAIEDKRFYKHDGVDYYRMFGAAVKDLEAGGKRQGGSTITMQLVKNLHKGGRVRSYSRKIQEAYLAYQYEKKYSKDQILTQYLNGTFYGHNSIGVQAASETYFGKRVSKLSLIQAAVLAGLPQAPSDYDPLSHPKAAKARRNLVLQAMGEQGYIPMAKAKRAMKAGLGLRPGKAYTGAKKQGFFFDYVRQGLINRFGARAVRQGGLRVYTTIDPELQTDATEAIKSQLYSSDSPSAAIVMMDSRTGRIRAMQSSATYGANSQFNLATATRQPGSTFKTFVLTRFVEDGHDPYSTAYVSRPLKGTFGGYALDVQTYSHSYKGRIPVAQALLSSDNSVFVQMTIDLTPAKVAETAYEMGVPKSRALREYPSLGLGSSEVSVLDMATAYSTLSNGGWRVTPLSVLKVERPRGKPIIIKPRREKVLSDGVTSVVTKILHNNVTGGTGTSANIAPAIAGKTGTTEDYTDAWFAAYTPCYTTVVWVGYPNADGTRRTMPGVTGGSIPAAIWANFMKKVFDNPAYKCRYADFPEPQDPASLSAYSSTLTKAPDYNPEPTTTAPAPQTPTETSPGGGGATPQAPAAPAPAPAPTP
ncbi:MAG: penicillin-binding protein, partial [Thermoleophilia bacterium]|nr:penicillin-binding protein [Thermoleophilia bacterium]